jgi:hypothetical protein
MIKRVTRSSVESLLISWDSDKHEQVKTQLTDEPLFMSVQRVAAIIDISESTVRRYIRRGDLMAIASEGPNAA